MIDFSHLNIASFFWLNHTAHALPDWLWSSLTVTGHTSVVFALFTLFLLPRYSSIGSRLITSLVICALLGGVSVTLLKESFQVVRPPAVLSADAFYLIGHKLELVSFPSGHTLTAFAVATLLIGGLQIQGWQRMGIVLVACCIGLSRVAVGVHWPLDVLAGSVLGIFCAYLSLIVTKWSYFNDRLATSVRYRWLQIALLWLVSLSLFATEMGYPKAYLWQGVVTVFGVTMSSFSAILHLNQIKRS